MLFAAMPTLMQPPCQLFICEIDHVLVVEGVPNVRGECASVDDICKRGTLGGARLHSVTPFRAKFPAPRYRRHDTLCWRSIMTDPTLVSLNMAASITGVSKRTLWRRIADGAVRAYAGGAGEKTLVDVAELRQAACIPLADEDVELLFAADNNRAEAQCELGLMFLAAERTDDALVWLRQAADKYYGEAMYWVARLQLEGEGMEQDTDAARRGFERAADYGHVLARHALEGLAAWMQDESLDPVAVVDAAERTAVTQVLEETRDAR